MCGGRHGDVLNIMTISNLSMCGGRRSNVLNHFSCIMIQYRLLLKKQKYTLKIRYRASLYYYCSAIENNYSWVLFPGFNLSMLGQDFLTPQLICLIRQIPRGLPIPQQGQKD